MVSNKHYKDVTLIQGCCKYPVAVRFAEEVSLLNGMGHSADYPDFNNPNPAPVTPPETQPSNTPPATSASDPPTQSGFARYLAFMRRDRNAQEGGDRERTRRPRAGTSATALSEEGHVGRGRRREADQTGPGGY